MLICDALIQYQAGKYASTPQPQNRIPARIVTEALEAFDPTLRLRFNPTGITGKAKLKPPCPHCGSTRVVSDGRLRYAQPRRWKCYGCGKGFEEAAAC